MNDLYAIDRAIKGNGLCIKTGPYTVHLKSKVAGLAKAISRLYYSEQIFFEKIFTDFHVILEYPNIFRTVFRPHIFFRHDGVTPFKPLPVAQAYPFFEWSLNWCIATYSNYHLILHAAVVEKNGHALIFPAAPGSGKSTLSAGLTARGWRLLSDEMAIIDPKTHELIPVVRPISLKNESIDVIKDFAPNFVFGSIVKDTSKGTVTHVKVPINLELIDQPAKPAWVVFPKFEMAAKTSLKKTSKAQAFLKSAEQSFNYNILGETGFNCLADLIDRCECYEFCYSDLDDAVRTFDKLAEEKKN